MEIRDYVKPEEEKKNSQEVELEGKTPIIVNGGSVTINVIERQYNEKTASSTVKMLLDKEKAAMDLITGITKTGLDMFDKYAAKKQSATQSAPPAPAPVKSERKVVKTAKRKVVKTKSKKRK